jgi:hypothetical protein
LGTGLASLRRALIDYADAESPGFFSVTVDNPETGEQRVIQLDHPDFWGVHVYIAVPTHGRGAASALRIGRDALALLETAENGALTRATTEALVASGHAELLVSHREGPWLECKEQPYGADERAVYELAKDVCAFANSASGGLIIIGHRARKVRGSDTITGVRPVPADDRRVERYRKSLNQRVYPRVSNLAVQEVEYGADRIVVVSVPPQPKALQPFLVKGAVRNGKDVGSNIAVYIRDEDAAVTASVEELHILIVAGRAALGYVTPAEERRV